MITKISRWVKLILKYPYLFCKLAIGNLQLCHLKTCIFGLMRKCRVFRLQELKVLTENSRRAMLINKIFYDLEWTHIDNLCS